MSALAPLAITPPPGVVKTEADRVIEGRWKDSDFVRWVRGRPQKMGGWTKAAATATSGTPRALHCWRDLSSNHYVAAGTYRKLYVYDTDFARNDITPYRSTGTLGSDPFTTTNGSASVTVAHTAHGINPGDTAIFSGSAAVGGITPNGTFTVDTVPNANSYTFTFTSAATSSVTGGGASVAFSYEIPVGVELGAYGLGYGVGSYGLGTYGDPHSGSTIFIEPRVWSLDHFGKYLLAAYNGGTIYLFDPTSAQPWARASKVDATAPTDVRFMFVTPERYVFALRDSMVVAWCSQGDYTTWTPATDNTANSRTLTEGTKLVAGRVLGPLVSLVWTDGAAYIFQWTGSSFIYDSRVLGRDCGLLGPNAAVTAGGVAYWMGPDNFFMYNGAVQPMPNVEDIRRYVYDDLDQAYGYQCAAVYVPKFNEIWFSWTPPGETNPTKTVVYSIDQQCWWPLANFARVSGSHFTQGDTRPYCGGVDGYIYQHEVGYNADGSAIEWSLTLAPYAMQEGALSMQTEYFVWNFHNQSGTISYSIETWDRPNDDAAMDSASGTVTTTTKTSDIQVGGRFIGFTLSGSGLGDYFRYGKPVAFVKPTGRRS